MRDPGQDQKTGGISPLATIADMNEALATWNPNWGTQKAKLPYGFSLIPDSTIINDAKNFKPLTMALQDCDSRDKW
jgi:hypothetical protein